MLSRVAAQLYWLSRYLERAEQDLIDDAVSEQKAKVEGRNAIMIVAPKKKIANSYDDCDLH